MQKTNRSMRISIRSDSRRDVIVIRSAFAAYDWKTVGSWVGADELFVLIFGVARSGRVGMAADEGVAGYLGE